MSILSDMNKIKQLSDEILQPKKREPMTDSLCPDCGAEMDFEKGAPERHDEPASPSGWWCSNCQEWAE